MGGYQRWVSETDRDDKLVFPEDERLVDQEYTSTCSKVDAVQSANNWDPQNGWVLNILYTSDVVVPICKL